MKTEYQMMKALCVKVSRLSPEHTARAGNSIVRQACVDAYDDLDCAEREVIRRNMRMLMANVDWLGKTGALELLAAVSEYV